MHATARSCPFLKPYRRMYATMYATQRSTAQNRQGAPGPGSAHLNNAAPRQQTLLLSNPGAVREASLAGDEEERTCRPVQREEGELQGQQGSREAGISLSDVLMHSASPHPVHALCCHLTTNDMGSRYLQFLPHPCHAISTRRCPWHHRPRAQYTLPAGAPLPLCCWP